MAKRPSLNPLPDILARLLKTHGMASRMLEFSLQEHWTEIVGDHVGRHTWPDSIRHHKLYLVAENSVWMHQLLFLKPELLAKINAVSDGEAITDIVMHVGSVATAQDSNGQSTGQTETPIQEPASQELNGDLRTAIDASVRPVTDPDLRERLRVLFAKSRWAAPKAG